MESTIQFRLPCFASGQASKQTNFKFSVGSCQRHLLQCCFLHGQMKKKLILQTAQIQMLWSLSADLAGFISLLAVPRRLFCFGSLVVLDVVLRYLSLCLLYINTKIGKNRCLMLD